MGKPKPDEPEANESKPKAANAKRRISVPWKKGKASDRTSLVKEVFGSGSSKRKAGKSVEPDPSGAIETDPVAQVAEVAEVAAPESTATDQTQSSIIAPSAATVLKSAISSTAERAKTCAYFPSPEQNVTLRDATDEEEDPDDNESDDEDYLDAVSTISPTPP